MNSRISKSQRTEHTIALSKSIMQYPVFHPGSQFYLDLHKYICFSHFVAKEAREARLDGRRRKPILSCWQWSRIKTKNKYPILWIDVGILDISINRFSVKDCNVLSRSDSTSRWVSCWAEVTLFSVFLSAKFYPPNSIFFSDSPR